MVSSPAPGLPASARGSRELVRAALLVVLGVALVGTWCGAALTWDGASLLFAFLDVQDVSVPHARLSVALLEYPTLLLSHFTTNVRALELVYGATYTLIPVVCVLASWRLLRSEHPRLIAWQFVWLCFGALPGQLFFVTESLIAAHVAWPILFAVLTGLPRRAIVPFGLAAAFSFELHPASSLLLFLVGGAAAATAVGNPERRKPLLGAAAFAFVAGAARAWVTLHDPYELSQAAVQLGAEWDSLRLPGLAFGAAAVAPFALVISQLVGPRATAASLGALTVLAICFGALMVPWASEPRAWQDELNYRFFAPFVAAPFLVGAAATALATPPDRDALTVRDGLVCVGAAALVAAVLTVQSAKWLELRRSLESTLSRSTGCITMSSVRECRGTALRWWPTPSYALLIQGHAPRALLLPGNECKHARKSTSIPVNPWYARPRNTGWFDLRKTGLGD
ncbi:MAG TPA: hypothetical protein VHC69_17840 [Polyangiaceae bacterium]|nr:hypothetical protein [Polyangiaceae bacterium]